MRPTHLSCDKGSLLVRSEAKVPYSTWDDRIREFRAQALYYNEIVEFLKSELSEVKDNVEELPPCPDLRCRTITMRAYQKKSTRLMGQGRKTWSHSAAHRRWEDHDRNEGDGAGQSAHDHNRSHPDLLRSLGVNPENYLPQRQTTAELHRIYASAGDDGNDELPVNDQSTKGQRTERTTGQPHIRQASARSPPEWWAGRDLNPRPSPCEGDVRSVHRLLTRLDYRPNEVTWEGDYISSFETGKT